MKKIDYLLTVVGIALIITGGCLVKTNSDLEGFMKVVPYLCIGFGCGLFGHGMGNIISYKVVKKYPDIEKQNEIEKNDERNILILKSAKAKAYDLMTYLFAALMLSFALMEVDMVVILLLVFSYLFVQFYAIYYRYKYEKEI